MQKYIVMIAILGIVSLAIAQDITPDTEIVVDGQTMTVAQLWQELETSDMLAEVEGIAFRDDSGKLYYPMSKEDEMSLAMQSEMEPEHFSMDAITSNTTIEKQYSNQWGVNSSFGVYLDAVARVAGDAATRTLLTNVNAGGYIFDTRISLFEFNANAQNNNSYPNASVSIKIAGQSIYSKQGVNLYVNPSFNRSWSASKIFTVGPVPINVKGTVSGTVGFRAALSLAENGFGLQGDIAPFVNTTGTVSAQIELGLIAFGAKGTLLFLNDVLSLKASADYMPSTKSLNLQFKLDNNLRTLDGSIGFIATVRTPLGNKEYEHTIFEWQGIQKNWTLLDLKKVVQVP